MVEESSISNKAKWFLNVSINEINKALY